MPAKGKGVISANCAFFFFSVLKILCPAFIIAKDNKIMRCEGKNLSGFLSLDRIADNRFFLADWARAHAPSNAKEEESNYKVEMALFCLLRPKGDKGCFTRNTRQVMPMAT